MSIETIIGYQEKVDWYLDKIKTQIETYSNLIDQMSQLEMEVRRNCMTYMSDNPDCKKVALEKIELLSCNDDNKKENYLQLIWMRHKQKSLEKVLEGTQSGLSALQSSMKYERSVDFTKK